jgi:hypothetical protein
VKNPQIIQIFGVSPLPIGRPSLRKGAQGGW